MNHKFPNSPIIFLKSDISFVNFCTTAIMNLDILSPRLHFKSSININTFCVASCDVA